MKILINLIFFSTLIFCVLAHGATQSQTVSLGVANFQPGYLPSDAPGQQPRVLEQLLSSVNKFDSSLGTLTDVQITAHFRWQEFSDFFANPDSNPPASSWSGSVVVAPIDAGIFFKDSTVSPATYTPLLTVASEQGSPWTSSVFCGGGSFDFFCEDHIDFLEIEHIANNRSVTSVVDINNFIGTGTVDSLTFGHVYPGNAAFIENNSTVSYSHVGILNEITDLTITYVYNDSSLESLNVPFSVPFYFGLGVLLVGICMSSKKDRNRKI